MNIKLDENIPATLKNILSQQGHQVKTTPDQKLEGYDDGTIWEIVQEEDRFFITQDLDFSDIRNYPPGSHSGLLLLRFRFPGREAMKTRVESAFSTENVEEWKGKFVVMTETKTRVHDQWPTD